MPSMTYKLMTRVDYGEDSRHFVDAVYTNNPAHPRLHACEGVYDMDTNVKWWKCSTDDLILDDREYKYFMLCQELVDDKLVPDKRNIIFNKQGEVVLLCNDETHYSLEFVYGSIESYLKTRTTVDL